MAVKEVLLCAGAFGSPHILMASGIGPSPHSTIPHIHTLPGVGRNLADHLGVPINFRASPTSHVFAAERGFFKIPKVLYNYKVNGTGVLTSQGAESASFARLEDIAPEFVAREKANGTWQDRSSGPQSPHIEILFVPAYYRHHNKMPVPDGEHYFTLIGLLLNPVSSGKVTISEVKDGKIETLIDPNFFEDEFDTRVMAEMIRYMRRLGEQMRQDPVCGGIEVHPGIDKVPNDDDVKLQEYVKRESSVYYHPTSTCRMGPPSDSLAVVDARLNVYGIDRLRVVDASVMPKIPAAHTCAPTIMIAEKAADMIKEDWKDPTTDAQETLLAKL
jgi:choline dehydrogenase